MGRYSYVAGIRATSFTAPSNGRGWSVLASVPHRLACVVAVSATLAFESGCAKQGADDSPLAPNSGGTSGSIGPTSNGGGSNTIPLSAGGSGSTAPATAGSVSFSVPSGTFTAPFTVTLSTATPNAEIRYTSDGAAPNATSTLYDGSPIDVSRSSRFVATQFVNGVEVGTPTSVYYVLRSGDITSDIPVIVIDDYGAGVPSEEAFVDASFMVFEPKNGATSLTDAPAVASRMGFHVRGQTSADFDKKSYRVELRDHLGNDADWALLGMPADSDWVLHGPFADKTLIHNAFAYSLGPDMGFHAPRFAFAELYLNTANSALGTSDYAGVYLLVETVKNKKTRLDLQQLRETDTTLPAITGGYIFKFELDVAEPPTLSCTGRPCWVDLEVYDPSPLNSEQQTWLNTHVQAFHTNLFGSGFSDPTTGYASYIDVDSFVNYFILSEVTRNLDGYIRSFYLYKDRDGKITVGPLWDYDLIAGAGLSTSVVTTGWQHAITRNASANGWLQRLITDPAFWSRVTTRYRELRTGVLSQTSIEDRIARLSAPLSNAATRNFQKWPNLRAQTIVYFTTSTANTWQGQLDAMRTWFSQRLTWLDSQL